MFDPYKVMLDDDFINESVLSSKYSNTSIYFEKEGVPDKSKVKDVWDKVKTAIELLIAKIKMKVEEGSAKIRAKLKDMQQKSALKQMDKKVKGSGAGANQMMEVADVWAVANYWKSIETQLWKYCNEFFTKDYKDIRSMEQDNARLNELIEKIGATITELGKKSRKMTVGQFQEFLKIEISGKGNIRKIQKEINENLMKLKAKTDFLKKKSEVMKKNNMLQYEDPNAPKPKKAVKAPKRKGFKGFVDRHKHAINVVGKVGFTALKIVSMLYTGMTVARMVTTVGGGVVSIGSSLGIFGGGGGDAADAGTSGKDVSDFASKFGTRDDVDITKGPSSAKSAPDISKFDRTNFDISENPRRTPSIGKPHIDTKGGRLGR